MEKIKNIMVVIKSEGGYTGFSFTSSDGNKKLRLYERNGFVYIEITKVQPQN